MSTPLLTPFRLTPHLVPKVWGGRALLTDWDKSAKDVPADATIGESWEVADLPEGHSIIATGPLQGRPLHDAVTTWSADLTGGDHDRFPLLVKLLDAERDLSVQVHPSDAHTHLFDAAHSKDECWWVLSSRDGAILHGLRDGIAREDFKAILRDGGDPTDLMRRKKVRAGDIVRVPPGTMHAICAGVTLLEIQQPSDTTFRVWDYNRPGMDGTPRDLHIAEAMTVTHFGDQPDILTHPATLDDDPRRALMIDVPAYRIGRIALADAMSLAPPAHSALVVIALEGACTIGDGLELRRGQTAILPAAGGEHIAVPHDSSSPPVLATASLGTTR